MEIIEKAKSEGRSTLSEHESKELLKAYGIPVAKEREVLDEDAFRAAIAEIKFPMVIKACAPHLSHKTERGLVKVDIRSEKEALEAYSHIKAETAKEGANVLVQEMVKGQRELVAGLTRDPQFGPCVMFGLGGIFTEILKDVSFRVAPIEMRDALEMMKEIKGRKILDSVRGMPPVDLEALGKILITLGNIGLENDETQEIDINPLILKGSEPVAVDALVVLVS